MARKKIDVVSLGCSKNLVDSERLLGMLGAVGMDARIADNPREADVTIINTCGFIGDAKEESINTILAAIQAKEAGMIKRIYVMGCLSERYLGDLKQELPEVDGWYGKFDWPSIAAKLARTYPVPYRLSQDGINPAQSRI